jgi:hypothetical protein
MRRFRGWLIVTTIVIATACSTPTPETATTAPVTAQPAQPQRAGFGSIGDVTPERLSLSGDQVATQTLSVSYSIPDPGTVTEATLKLYVGEIGDIATQTITPEANGVAQFSVQPRSHSIGPAVRFRASCPQGETGWYTMGQMPLDYDDRMSSKTLQIGSVMPQSIRWSPALDGSAGDGAAQRVTVWGPTLTPDCKVEAQVNGSSVELMNVRFMGKGFEGLLKFRDIGNTTISPRYAELKLLITRNGRKTEAIKRIAFLDL